jgi:hypothetical protein
MSTHRDVLKMLADARPSRLDPDPSTRPDPAAFTSYAQDANAGRSATRPTRRLMLAGLVPTVAVAVVGAVLLTLDAGSGTPAPGIAGPAPASAGQAPRSASELFLVAAERTGSNTATTGNYWAVNTEHGQLRAVGAPGRSYNIMVRNSTEMWLATRPNLQSFAVFQSLGAKPVSAGDEAAWKADGSPTEWTELPPKDVPDAGPIVHKSAAGPRYLRGMQAHTTEDNFVLGGTPVTVAELAALPTDPAALKAALLKRFKDNGSLEPDDYSLFWTGRHLIVDLPVSPRVRAAAYRMLADVKGVTFLGPATDQRGRAGLAVAYTRKGDGGTWSQTRLIIDPQTGQALAQESWNLGRGASAAASGELLSYEVLMSAGYSNGPLPTNLPTPPSEK